MTALNDCGCCEGITVETPAVVSNRPGLTAIAYRVGTHAQFKASMLARLSDADLPELAHLRTRDDDDFTIALIDAWALVSDILTFYQERIANESYLRTATERGSVINLSRLIGYELRPGVAASTYLAFTLETGAGSPSAVTIEKRLKVQSVPGPGEKPQAYETVEEVEARPEWNALQPQLAEIRWPQFGDTEIYLAGVTTNLKAGDALLIIGDERVGDPKNENWDFRRIVFVEADADNERTLVRWSEGLGREEPRREPAQKNPKVYALRLRASLFGHNAQQWEALPVALRVGEINPQTNKFEAGPFPDKSKWAEAKFGSGRKNVNLDSVYNQVAVGSWLVLTAGKTAEVYEVTTVAEEAKADYNLSAKTTLVGISGENIRRFSPRNSSVFAQSEELEIADTPITDPIWKDEITLDGVVEGLQPERTLIVSGKRMRVRMEVAGELKSDDGSDSVPLAVGDTLVVKALPADVEGGALRQRWNLIDKTGFEGFIEADRDDLALIAADDDDETVSEVIALKEAVLDDASTHTVLKLAEVLENVYDRTTAKVYANVALSTHGETVKDEILGSGDAGEPYQSFELKQSPLTYTPADTASGGETTLEVRVNDLKWSEVSTLFGHGPRERIYVTHANEDQETTIHFGDGITGARLPMGRENVEATYRKGIGLDGLVHGGQLSLLMTRPLGVRGVVNPLPSEGAQDPQDLDDARENSPLTVLTLDRIVSLRDYEDFARSFSGIAKALATWTWSGHTRRVFVTVAGIDGAGVKDRSVLHTKLVSAMQKAGDAFVPIAVETYRSVTFKVIASVKVDPDHVQEKVLDAVESALKGKFSFDARAFGQPVTLSEVIAVVQDVSGVVAVDVDKLHRADADETRETFLPAFAPQVGADPNTLAAELLTIDPESIELRVMS